MAGLAKAGMNRVVGRPWGSGDHVNGTAMRDARAILNARSRYSVGWWRQCSWASYQYILRNNRVVILAILVAILATGSATCLVLIK